LTTILEILVADGDKNNQVAILLVWINGQRLQILDIFSKFETKYIKLLFTKFQLFKKLKLFFKM